MREFLSKLRKNNIHLKLEAGELSVRYPKDAVDAALLEEINAKTPELVQYLKARNGQKHSGIPAAAAQPDYPLSSAQRRLWVLSQVDEGNRAYNIPIVYTFEGSVDLEALTFAFRKLLERYEILRTSFNEDGQGNVRQFIHPASAIQFNISYHDLRGVNDPGQKIKQLVEDDTLKPFDLSQAPLLRASLYQLQDNTCVLEYVVHHLVCDDWSMDLFIGELLKFYHAHLSGQQYQPAPLRIHYKDYATYQQKQLMEGALQPHKEYWLKQFEGELPVLDLPVDKPRPAVRTYNGATVNRRIDAALSNKVQLLGKQHGATLFMTLLSAINTLLNRYTGQEDIITGSVVAGRDHADLEDQIGFFINTLALRITFSAEDSFETLLKNVKRVALNVYQHQAYPFDELVNELKLQRDMSRNALFDVMVVLQNAVSRKGRNEDAQGVEISRYHEAQHVISKFDLTFLFIEVGDELQLNIEYNTDIYLRETVAPMAEHFVQLLRAIVESPSTPIYQLDYLSKAEMQRLVFEFNDTGHGYPQDKTIVHLFEEQVERTPNNIALKFEQTALTYNELNTHANQLAHYLRENYNIHPDGLIGIKLERGEWMIISILAILKSGGAYVPIDPAYPQERIDYMISDSGCKLVIDDIELNKFRNDLHPDRVGGKMGNPVRVVASASHLAYVIYTSGTTGKPKGALIEHRNVVRLLQPDRRLFDFNEQDVWTMFHSYCFDFSVWEMYGALLFGGTLVVVPSKTTKDPEAYLELLTNEGVTVLNQTPSAFYNLTRRELENDSANLRLRYVIFGGEELTPGKLAGFRKRHPSTKLINMYGITETTVHVTYKEITEVEITNNISNIGVPIPTLGCYILDNHQNLLPAGIPGELYVSGAGVARGYLNRETLTAQRFLPNPFRQGERMYRSGDKARRMSNGEMEYMGRIDEQVKVRGYRIELGEIEKALIEIEFVKQAAVLAKKDRDGDAKLICYLVSNQELSAAAIRGALSMKLPVYMIPAHYVQLQELPLTRNGKLDKKALPMPGDLDIDTGVEMVAPTNIMEERLLRIWKEVLGRDGIGIRHNFFDLGGDSIKILRLAAALKKELQLNIPIAYIYKNSTVEGIASYVLNNVTEIAEHSRMQEEKETQVRKEIDALKERMLAAGAFSNADNIEDIYMMSAIQKGMLFGSLLNEGTGVYHDQFLFRQRFADFDARRFTRALELMVDKHSILRTSFFLSEFETELQVVHKRVDTATGYKDLSALEPAEQEAVIALFMKAELKRPFNVSEAPLWRMDIFDLGNDEYRFLWQFHHAILDGWSNASLITELNNLYVQLAKDAVYSPEPLKSSYKDFVVRHEIDQNDETVQDFWRHELEDFSRPELFTDENESKQIGFGFDTEFREKLEKAAAVLNTTVKTLSLSAYLYLLKVLNYNNDIIVGLVTNTRPDFADGDKMLGCFLNTVPVRMRIREQEPCSELVARTHAKLLELKDKERLSLFGIAQVNNEQPERGNPFSDVLFNYVDFHIYDTLVDEPAQENGKPGSADLVGGRERTNTYLDCTVSLTGKRVSVSFTLSKKLKAGFGVDKLATLYRSILAYFVEHPYEAINESTYLSDADKHQLVYEFNDTDKPYPKEKTLIELFSEQAERTPGNTALIFEGASLSFRELHEQSNQLAAYLRGKYKIAPDDLIGLKMERGIGLVVSMLSILKAGAGCVPMDIEYPQQRINYMMSNSGCKALVDEQELQAFYQHQNEFSTAALPQINWPSNLAFVIYTSGSTGNPKGCMLEHKGVINHLYSKIDLLGLTAADAICHSSQLHFVGGIWQLFAPLATGGKVVLTSRDTLPDVAQLLETCQQHGVRVLELIPSQLNEHLSTEGMLRAGCIETLILTGEKLDTFFVKECFKGNDLRVVNTYGQTESSDVTTSYVIPRNNMLDTVLIGKPIRNMHNYILSPAGMLCPAGVAGEVCTSGDGVCRGYINQPALTAEKFTQDPFREGLRMYRTGDFGRWLADGTLEIIGRRDDQVKIRGHRVETREIEDALLALPGIEKAVVLLKKDPEHRLIAYLSSKEQPNAEWLRAQLSAKLPQYMIPAEFTLVEKWPLLPNGKTDKKALTVLDTKALDAGTTVIAPRNDVEERLAQIWKKVLQREQVGMQDNFFSLGGHSLKATRLVSQLHKAFEVKIALRDVFTYPLAEQQAALIQQARKSQFRPVTPVPQQSSYPLSSAQRRLWVLAQMEEGNLAYNIPGAYVMEGDLDHESLEHALNALISRHEILRTIFKEDENGDVRQFILSPDDAAIEIALVDLANEHAQSEKLEAQMHVLATQPFNLARGPLLRACLYKLSAKKWVFSYVLHHIISDRGSLEVLVKELLLLYNGFTVGASPNLQPLQIQYKDYAAWQQKQLEGEFLQEHKTYWLKQLDGELPVLTMPEDKPRPSVKTYNGGIVTRSISKRLTRSMKLLCGEEDATLFMGLLAAVDILLYRYTGQEDIIIGSPVSGRSHSDLEDQIGFYVNTLALRVKLGGTHSYKQLLAGIKQQTLDAYDHLVYPFDQLINELKLARDVSRSPLFDVLIDFHDNRVNPLLKNDNLQGISVSGYNAFGRNTSKYDLTFMFMESDEGLNLVLEYNSDLYLPESIERMAVYFANLLQGIVSAPATPIGKLQFITEEERNRLLNEFNDVPVNYSGYKPVLALFDEYANTAAGEPALEFEGSVLSYGQLQEKSNRLANCLVDKYKVQPGDLVGIMLDRSAEMIVAILGILRAGAAYVPVDPTYPSARKEYILNHTGIKTLITQTEYIFDIEYYTGEIFAVDAQQYSDHAATSPEIINNPNDSAYVIYTSGSTGAPKGCIITQGNLSHYIQWANNYYFSSLKPVFGLFTSLSFDLTITSIFCSLTRGGKLFIYPQQQDLMEILRHSFNGGGGINAIKLTPSHISLLKQLDMGSSTMHCAITGGEQVTEDHVRTLKLINPFIEIYNEYGPTETTVGCIVDKLNVNTPITIGKPISNTKIYILDEELNLSATGVPGEIFISGSGVSKGYLNNETLTSEKFMDDPFNAAGKMYRTGDIARWLPDGKIAFIGRKDEQVKIKGFRIEPGEIEKTLLSHPNIDAAVVAVKTNTEGEKELAAYYISKETLAASTLRTFLGDVLPAYMVPSYFVQLDQLPLTVNGKINREKLPDPNKLDMQAGMPYVAPGNEVEAQLALIWEEVLNRKPIGMHDNLFEIGANSLKLVKVVGMVNKQFNVRLTVVNAFRLHNIGLMAEFIQSGTVQDAAATDAELQASVDTMDEMIKLYDQDEQ